MTEEVDQVIKRWSGALALPGGNPQVVNMAHDLMTLAAALEEKNKTNERLLRDIAHLELLARQAPFDSGIVTIAALVKELAMVYRELPDLGEVYVVAVQSTVDHMLKGVKERAVFSPQ